VRIKDDNKRKQIHQAALKLVSEVGLSGISMAAIAKQAGIATGSLYTYYSDKEKLINGVYADTLKLYSKKLFDKCSPLDPVKVAVRKIFENYLRYALSYYQEWIFQEQYLFSIYAENNTERKAMVYKLLAPLVDVIEKGKKELLIKDIDVRYHLLMLLGFGNELALAVRLKAFKLNKEYIDTAFHMYWDAMKA
jgi:AcrR family transcriptional regulator